jgi:hypothetical protein
LYCFAAGFDGLATDPLGGDLGLSTSDFSWATHAVSDNLFYYSNDIIIVTTLFYCRYQYHYYQCYCCHCFISLVSMLLLPLFYKLFFCVDWLSLMCISNEFLARSRENCFVYLFVILYLYFIALMIILLIKYDLIVFYPYLMHFYYMVSCSSP